MSNDMPRIKYKLYELKFSDLIDKTIKNVK